MTLEQRFWPKVRVTPSCWLWTASQNGVGYGQIWAGRRVRLAHRVSYEMHLGPIPAGLQIDHLCRNRLCVRPDHLEPVTMITNVLRGERPNRTHCPSGHKYVPENTYRDPQGHRRCRTRHRAESRARETRRAAA